MKIIELFEKISVSHIRDDLNRIIQKTFDKYAGKIMLPAQVFDKNSEEPIHPSLEKDTDGLKKIEKELKKYLKPYGVTNVIMQAQHEKDFHDKSKMKGSFGASGTLVFFVPFELFDKNHYFGDEKKEYYASLIKAIIIHEVVHAIQNQKFTTATNKEPKFLKNNPNDDIKKYYSSSKEIEAHALNTTEMLMHKFKNKQAILNAIRRLENNEEINDILGSSITTYLNNFARSKEIKDTKIWKKFLKKLYQHIMDY